jgi:hypothetical protein
MPHCRRATSQGPVGDAGLFIVYDVLHRREKARQLDQWRIFVGC